MQRLCVLMTMGACLVASAPDDVAVRVQRGVITPYLTSNELTKLHMCMCTDAHATCIIIKSNGTSTSREVSQNTSSTQYSNVYTCTLFATYITCARNTQNGQTSVDDQRNNNSFSLHGNETCDIRCVDVTWDRSDISVTLYTNKTNAEQCPVKSLSDPPAMTHTTTIIIVASCLIFIIISVIIVICIYTKRKSQVKNPAVYTVKAQACSYRDVDTNCGLYAVSPETSWHPYLDENREQEPLYFEVEKDKLDPNEVRESIQIESNNVYSQLHDRTENVMNEYDVLPR